jgi:hypothetical protein
LDILTKVQEETFEMQDNPYFQTFGIMYLPVFLVPFQLFALLKLPISYILWNSINLIVFIVYLRFFIKQFSDKPFPHQWLVLAIISLPLYINLYEGQVNVLLVVCIGEFIRAIHTGRRYAAGLWLGGLLLKPQLLILILPFLLIRRSRKMLIGFSITSFVVLALSYALVGNKGLVNLSHILLQSARGDLASNPAAMINWRMLGWHIASVSTPTIGEIVTIAGSLMTIGIVFYRFRKNISQDKHKFLTAIFGIFAATLSITWHSHFHTALILIPFILFLLINNNFKLRLYSAWVLIPIAVQFLFYIQTGLVFLGVPHAVVTQIMKFEEGFRGLALNLLLVGWAIKAGIPLKENPEIVPVLSGVNNAEQK